MMKTLSRLLLAVAFTIGHAIPLFESTQENISLFIPYDSLGLDTGATVDSIVVLYRAFGETDWKTAHPLLKTAFRDTGWNSLPALGTSIFNLVPGTEYEIKINRLVRTIRTWSDAFPSTGRDIYVNPRDGDDLNSGLSPASAKASINAVVRAGLQPGDRVHLAGGRYFEEVALDSIRGLPDNYILFQGDGDSVVLEGYDSSFHPASWERTGTDSSGNPVFRTDLAFRPDGGYIENSPAPGLDGMIYQYHETNGWNFGQFLPDLYANKARANSLGAFYHDSLESKVYLALPPGTAPESLKVRFSNRKACLKLRYSSHLAFRNLDIRHSGYYGLSLEGCNDIRVTGCLFRFHKSGICANAGILNFQDSLRCYSWGADTFCFHDMIIPNPADSQLSNRCVVESCLFTSPKAWEWNAAGTWGFMHDNEFGAARHHLNGVDASYAGTGWIVRHCRFDNLFNGLYISQNGERYNLDDLRTFRNFDFHGNTMIHIADDCLEPEGAAVNLRIYKNRFTLFRNGLSDCPTTVGPLFFMRNVLSGWIEGGIKAKEAWGSDVGVACHYHNTFYVGNDRYAQAKTVISAQCDLNDRYINNIFAGGASVYAGGEGGGGPGSGNTMDCNSYYLSTGSNYLVFSGGLTCPTIEKANDLGYELNGLFNIDRRAPLFRDFNPDALDVSLRPGAVEIDRGVRIPGVNDAFKGLGPEMGAMEFDPDDPAVEGGNADREPLCTAFPNPFNGTVRLSFSIPQKTPHTAELGVFNVAGKKVFYRAGVRNQGSFFRIDWQGRDNHGEALPSGIYLVEWSCLSGRTARKVVYTR